jgi:phosphohistidine phosphatase
LKTIYFVRHAKSDWDSPFSTDHERGLSTRGFRNANSLRKFLRSRGTKIDAAFISDAARSQETFRIVNKSSLLTKNVNILSELYDADQEVFIQNIHKLPDIIHSVLFVGHNPEIESVINLLLGIKGSIFTKFSTSALAILSFDTNDWNKIHLEIKGTLTLHWVPSKIEKR